MAERIPFDPASPLVVRRPLTFGGRKYGRGEPFEGRATRHQKIMMFKAGYVETAPHSPKLPPIQPTEEQPASAKRHTVAHRGGGFYDVLDPTGAVVPTEKALRKADAETLAASLNEESTSDVDLQRGSE